MTVVVDASIAVRWLFPIANDERADEVARTGAPVIAPDLVIAEITNAAWKMVAFENFNPQAVELIVASANRAFDELVPCALLHQQAFRIAVELRHSVYDCFYLALAEGRDCEMLTADERLARRCSGTRHSRRVNLFTARSGRHR